MVKKKRKVGKYATLHSATQNLLGPASDAEEYEKKGKESFIIQMIHCIVEYSLEAKNVFVSDPLGTEAESP